MDDLHIIGAHLIDPAQGVDEVMDVAVSQGHVRAVGDLGGRSARTSVEAGGQILTPGLIDMHTHLHHQGTFWGMSPDPVAWHTGVTTWVDGGSVGAYGLAAMMEANSRQAVRTAVLLNIAAQGLAARTGEARDLANLDVEAAVTAIVNNPSVVHGLKVRMDSSTVGDNGLDPLKIALEVGLETGVPVMVHIGRGPFGLDEIVDLLREGDIITHCSGRAANGVREPGPVRDSLTAAYQRGVIFDLGHGAGGFSFEVLDSYLEQGMPPHVVSSDLHVLCASGPAFDLATVMAKLIASGMALNDVIRAATATPAEVLDLPGGTLAPGTVADMALFSVEEGEFTFGDVHGLTRRGTVRLRNTSTFIAGRPMLPSYPLPPPSWVDLSTAQRDAWKAREQALRDILNEPLVAPADVQSQIPSRKKR